MNVSPDKNEKSAENSSNRFIYRIMTFQRLKELLLYNKNTLVKPSSWDDPIEGLIARKIHSENKQRFDNYDLCRFFGQCWTLKPASNAIWSIYSNITDGIRIRTTVDKLRKSTGTSENVCSYIGNVAYKNISNFSRNSNILQCIESELCTSNNIDQPSDNLHNFHLLAQAHMYKRKAFDYEKEVRLMCHVREDDKNNKKEFYPYCICPNKLIDQIMIHPLVGDTEFKNLKKDLKKLGFKKTIERSKYLEIPQSLKKYKPDVNS